MLIFTPRPKLGLVSESLSSAGISLEHPTSYNPSDYPHHPEYQNPHNPPVGGYMQDAHMRRALTSGIFGAGGMGSIVQSKEMSEEQKRKQVDSVYASLRSGDELEQVEPGPLIVTQLFPHQKQALAFLLLRERERSFDEEPQGGSGESSTLNGHQSNDKSKVRAKAEDEDGGTISLWRVVRGSNGRARSYENVVTNSVTQQEPTICRGAILADDMGLGKTITIIALIAHTQSEAITFGSSPLEPLPPDRRNAKNGAEDLTADDFGMMVYGQPPAKKSKGGKKGGKKEAKNKDAERARREALVTRSRATLIVCPLSIVSNWVSTALPSMIALSTFRC